MSLAMLLYPPPTSQGMAEWSYHHLQHHRAINSAVSATRGVSVEEFDVWPLRANNFDNFLAQNQKWHDATNGVLGTSGVDLRSVDFTNAQQRDAWLFLHFSAHRAWAQVLGGGV